MQIQEEQLRQALSLVTSNDSQALEDRYYATLRQQDMAAQEHEYPVFDYEYKDRKILYSYSHKTIVRAAPIDFFEFGVFQGDSFRQWMQINTHPESRFFGFDSFEGLPEHWHAGNMNEGHFSTNGRVPEITDPRGSFITGFFNTSLRPFLETYERQNKMVIHVDADLCSSSLYALMAMDPFIDRGTLIVFDDFGPADEYAALYHYSKSCCREWRVVATRKDFHKLSIVITK